MVAPGMIACGSASQASSSGIVPDEVGLRETGRVVEAVHLARRLADDLEQRRTLPNWLGWIRGVASRALLLEQRRSIGRLGSGQRHLRAGDLRNQQRAAKSQPDWPCFARLCHTHHRWRAQTLGRGKRAVVVAGCFRAEKKAVVPWARPGPENCWPLSASQ